MESVSKVFLRAVHKEDDTQPHTGRELTRCKEEGQNIEARQNESVGKGGSVQLLVVSETRQPEKGHPFDDRQGHSPKVEEVSESIGEEEPRPRGVGCVALVLR
mmetsp:Transcript_8584/g.25451  ORF Transcript_8584/g.25451 Transcript_8584/m.25451 type:complete len:103 (+) Transcript_8584:325-633(+)